MIVAFKTVRLRKEWETLKFKNPRFYLLLSQIFSFFPTMPIITHIWRSEKEQDIFYSDNPDYKSQSWRSVHEFWRGMDTSVRNLEDDEVVNLLISINKSFSYGDNKHKTALQHDIGRGSHIHLQIKAREPHLNA